MSSEGGCSTRSADLAELAASGFVLEESSLSGVAYRASAMRLCPRPDRARARDGRVGRRVAVWNRVIGTNDLAAHAAASTANEGLVILAEEQTAGRGERATPYGWLPASSSLLMPVLLFPSDHWPSAAGSTRVGAVAVAEVVAAWTGLDARISGPTTSGSPVGKSPAFSSNGVRAVIGIGAQCEHRACRAPRGPSRHGHLDPDSHRGSRRSLPSSACSDPAALTTGTTEASASVPTA